MYPCRITLSFSLLAVSILFYTFTTARTHKGNHFTHIWVRAVSRLGSNLSFSPLPTLYSTFLPDWCSTCSPQSGWWAPRLWRVSPGSSPSSPLLFSPPWWLWGVLSPHAPAPAGGRRISSLGSGGGLASEALKGWFEKVSCQWSGLERSEVTLSWPL